jgi:flavin-dependent dehydrogenase
MHVSARGYAGLAPHSDGTVNVGLVMPMKNSEFRIQNSEPGEHNPKTKIRVPSGRPKSSGAVARFEDFAFSFPGVAECLRDAERVSGIRGMGPIGARVSRNSGDGYLLVGDAAGFFDPFTGEGVYKALRGAELAAQVAAGALDRNDLSARSLGRYSALAKAEFSAKELVCRLVQLFVGLPPAMDYVAARLASRPGPREVLTGVLGDYVDPRSALRPSYLWSLLRP